MSDGPSRPPRARTAYHPAMTGELAADYCPEGCYWRCEHRAAGARPATSVGAPARDRWQLGPGDTDDDPEQQALDEWVLWSVAGVPPAGGFRSVEVCTDCGETFRDAAAHAHEHARRRQLGLDR